MCAHSTLMSSVRRQACGSPADTRPHTRRCAISNMNRYTSCVPRVFVCMSVCISVDVVCIHTCMCNTGTCINTYLSMKACGHAYACVYIHVCSVSVRIIVVLPHTHTHTHTLSHLGVHVCPCFCHGLARLWICPLPIPEFGPFRHKCFGVNVGGGRCCWGWPRSQSVTPLPPTHPSPSAASRSGWSTPAPHPASPSWLGASVTTLWVTLWSPASSRARTLRSPS